MIRELRGLSQENISHQLGMTQGAYSKIENNQNKLSTELLSKIAAVLEVNPLDIMTQQPAIVNFQVNQGTLFGNIETVITNQKELYEQLLASKDAEIERLQKLVERLITKK